MVEPFRHLLSAGVVSVCVLIAGLVGQAAAVAALTPQPSAAPSVAPTTPADVAFSRGAELFNHHAFREAIVFLDQAIALDPARPSPYAFRAQSRFELGEYEVALKDADAAVAHGQTYPIYRVFVAEAEWALGLVDSAASDYVAAARALWTAPDGNADAWGPKNAASASFVLRASGHAQAARDVLAECAKRCRHSKDYDIIRYLRGEISAAAYLKSGKTTYAFAVGEGVIAYDLVLKGRRPEAMVHGRRALSVAEDGPRVVPGVILRKALSP